jgi:hypothetical protein
MLCRVVLVRTDGSEERVASIIRVTRIGELITVLAVTSNSNQVSDKFTSDHKSRPQIVLDIRPLS